MQLHRTDYEREKLRSEYERKVRYKTTSTAVCMYVKCNTKCNAEMYYYILLAHVFLSVEWFHKVVDYI